MNIIRSLGLRFKYWQAKIKYRHAVTFNGYTVCFAFPDSIIEFKQGKNKTTVNSDLV